jgi:serine O-acetyltransferase
MGWNSDVRRDLAACAKGEGQGLAMLVKEPSLWALVNYRLVRHAPPALRPAFRVSGRAIEVVTGVSISNKADLAPGVCIGHFGGIFIASGVVIGEGCVIMQGVTIGYGRVKRGMPILGRNVYVGPGAKIFGPVTIGDDAFIGANSVVTSDVPPGARVRPAPAEIIVEGQYSGEAAGPPGM